MRTHRFHPVSCITSVSVAGLFVVGAVTSAHGAPPPRGPSFDNDPYDDTAFGAPRDLLEDTTSRNGAVELLYGTFLGPQVTGRPHHIEAGWSLDSGVPAAHDSFGAAMAWGDFNGDCFDDLAVGAPGDDLDGLYGAGSVHVYFGSANGLDATPSRVLFGGPGGGGADASEAHSQFGYALTAGDFDGDGSDDLAIGVPFADSDGYSNSGAVVVVYGATDDDGALDQDAAVVFTQDSWGLPDSSEYGDTFGRSLVAGDFDCNGIDDLAIGHPNEGVGASEVRQAGSVTVLYGTPPNGGSSLGGLDAATSQLFHQGTPSVLGAVEAYDRFGATLASGYFNDDECADLVIGVPDEDVGSKRAGALNIIFGGTTGLDPASPNPDQILHLGREGFNPSEMRMLGSSLVVGRFNDDEFDDLAVGAPWSWLPGGKSSAGRVFVFPGQATRLGSEEWYEIRQDDTYVESSEKVDYFGWSLGYAEFAGEDAAFSSLLIGARGEDSWSGHMGHIEFIRAEEAFTQNAGFGWFQDDIEGMRDTGDQFGAAALPSRNKARVGGSCREDDPGEFEPPTENPSCEGFIYYDLCDSANVGNENLQPYFCEGVYQSTIGAFPRPQVIHGCNPLNADAGNESHGRAIFLGCYPAEEAATPELEAEMFGLCGAVLEACLPNNYMNLQNLDPGDELGDYNQRVFWGRSNTEGCCGFAAPPCWQSGIEPNVLP